MTLSPNPSPHIFRRLLRSDLHRRSTEERPSPNERLPVVAEGDGLGFGLFAPPPASPSVAIVDTPVPSRTHPPPLSQGRDPGGAGPAVPPRPRRRPQPPRAGARNARVGGPSPPPHCRATPGVGGMSSVGTGGGHPWPGALPSRRQPTHRIGMGHRQSRFHHTPHGLQFNAHTPCPSPSLLAVRWLLLNTDLRQFGSYTRPPGFRS